MADAAPSAASLPASVPAEQAPTGSPRQQSATVASHDSTADVRLPPSWREISPLLERTQEQLRVGELVHPNGFTLFEAMCAVELMDPKMDAGMHTGDGFRTVEEAVQGGLAPTELTDLQLRQLVDHVLTCEATWHAGHSLAQTVLTCLYLHQPERTRALPVLRAYLQAVLHSTVAVKELAEASCVHEEEDFIPFTFNFDIEPATQGDDWQPGASRAAALAPIISSLLQQRETFSPGSKDEERVAVEALLCRMKFRESFLRVLEALHCTDRHEPDFRLAAKEIALARKELYKLSPPTSSDTATATVTQHSPFPLNPDDSVGFDVCVSRQLLAPAPPRKIVLLNAKETSEHYSALLSDFEYISTVKDLAGLESLLDFMMGLRNRTISVIARSQLYAYLKCAWKGQVICKGQSLKELILGALGLRNAAIAEEWLQLPQVEAFMDKAQRALLSLLKVLCTNHARQQRRITHIFDDWEDLLNAGHAADTTPEMEKFMAKHGAARVGDESGYWDDHICQTWVTNCVSLMQMHFFLLGIQLELFGEYELPMIYWYVDYIIGYRADVLHGLERRYYKLVQKRMSDSQSAAKKSPKRKSKEKQELEDQQAWLLTIQEHILLTDALRHMTRGLLWALVGLEKLGLVPGHATPFNEERERYQQRFYRIFRLSVPPALEYEMFQQSTDVSSFTGEALIEMAANTFAKCIPPLMQIHSLAASTSSSSSSRALPANVDELKVMQRVAMTNKIALSVVAGALAKDEAQEGLQVTVDFSTHRTFYVLQISRRSKAQEGS